jgi:hypothetical protein
MVKAVRGLGGVLAGWEWHVAQVEGGLRPGGV